MFISVSQTQIEKNVHNLNDNESYSLQVITVSLQC